MMFPGYRVVETLHEGSNAIVLRGERVADGRQVILKRLAEDYPSPERLASFRQEYEINRKVSERAEQCSLERIGNDWLMVLEDAGGVSLDRLGIAGRLDIVDFLRLALRITETVAAVHGHLIIHRDINPANITLNEDSGAVRLIDFGASTLLSRSNASFSNPAMLEGTLPYIAPEQTGRMNRTVDLRADLYSLGITLYELLVGKTPFTTDDPLELVHSHVAKLPPDPREFRPKIPEVVARIILKLLAKNAEERYQSALGLHHDLSRCLELAEEGAEIAFERLGERDVSDRLHIPETLYGRGVELTSLLAAFERVRTGGCEMAVVAGAPGIGKSALVRELYGPITRARGFFVSGKFDQFNRNVPYSSLIQAFRALVRQLLTEPPARIAGWRQKILDALGPNGQVMIRVIPEVELITGPQPDVPDLRPEDAQNRFNLSFQAFIQVFTSAKHPLVVFLDDLQWADRASLDLLEVLLSSSHTGHLLIVGAHRSNEVDVSHPLRMTLERIRRRGVALSEIDLPPLRQEHVAALLSDALSCESAEVEALAALLTEKTGGNPFFVGEFLRHLYDDGLVGLDTGSGRWRWDLEKIRQRNITENVVELMSQKARDLDEAVQQTLKYAAALGNRFDLEAAIKTADLAANAVVRALWKALQAGFISPVGEAPPLLNLDLEGEGNAIPAAEFRFTHDRIQQALYALIPPEDRPLLHRKIGRHLLENTAPSRLRSVIFAIVGHLNRARDKVKGWDERLELGRLNQLAGERAVDAAAFAAAYTYYKAGADALGAEGWLHARDLSFTLHLGAAESACMISEFEAMEAHTGDLLGHTSDLLERVKIREIQIQAKTIQVDLPGALAMSVDTLRELGVRIPRGPSKLDVMAAILKTKAALAGKRFADFASLPEATDPRLLARAEVIANAVSSAYRSDPNTFILLILELVKQSVRSGNTPASGFAYACYALILAGALGDIDGAKRLYPVCDEMVEWPLTRPFKSKTLFFIGNFVVSWIEHPEVSAERLYDGYLSGLEIGDLEYASHCGYLRCYFLHRSAENLRELQVDLQQMADALEPLAQGRSPELCNMYLQVAKNLRGDCDNPLRLIGEKFDIDDNLRESYRLRDTRAIVEASVQKLYVQFILGDRIGARETADRIPEHLAQVPGFAPAAESRFWDALLVLQELPELSGWAKIGARRRVLANLTKLRKWGESTPAAYRHLCLLIEAELARVEGRSGEAREIYDQAFAAAGEQRMPRDQALIAEVTAAFYREGGFDNLANHFVKLAHRIYLRWGAAAKVKKMEEEHPFLISKPTVNLARGATINATVALSSTLDLTSVLRASQAISREIVQGKLLAILIKVVLESAGADRGLLLQSREGAWVATVEGQMTADGLAVDFDLDADGDRLPLSMLHYVARTREVVVRDKPDAGSTFSDDSYLVRNRIRSILCTPLVNQSRLVGILYLENSVSDGAFYQARLAFLEMLAAQMATSLENADLFANLERKVDMRTAELSEANDLLQSSNQELDAFARTVAHDLKNPLGTIAGYARYLLDDIADIGQEEVVEVLERIAQTGDQSVRIVNELLLLASVRKGAIQMAKISMGEVVDGALGRLDAMIKEYNAEIIKPTAWPAALGHAPWVEEIWANYISNALKYGGRPPIVEVGSDTLADGTIRFWVRDNGPGITVEEQRNVFAEFTRLEGARADGHGLGLSIVKRIADRLDGAVGLSSELGVGSLFYFTLPAAPAE
ncbi:MAG: AAA family ATPase [Myxococcales bacterium]|nr:AAA family ATPase [Myxococcales bacterium]